MYIQNLDRFYNSFIERLSKQKTTILVLYTVGLDVIVTLIFSNILFPFHKEGPVFSSRTDAFIIAVLIGPLIETLLFQHWIIKLILKKKKTATLLSAIVSAFLFSISHYYSWAYVFKTFISGLLFASLFLIMMRKNRNPILIVFLAHAIYNAIGLIITILSNTL